MLTRLPETIDPMHLADKRGALKGHIPLQNLTRLADLLLDDSGSIAVELVFFRQGRLALIEGSLEATLNLKCQNCLEAVPYTAKSVVKLGIVTTVEQANRLPDDYEPLLLSEEKILLADLIEDELLLLIPDYPKHDVACFKTLIDNTHTVLAPPILEAKKNPFSILASLNTSENINGRTKK
ncbi:MAG: YceD family protein [Methylococcaceae bacterium]